MFFLHSAVFVRNGEERRDKQTVRKKKRNRLLGYRKPILTNTRPVAKQHKAILNHYKTNTKQTLNNTNQYSASTKLGKGRSDPQSGFEGFALLGLHFCVFFGGGLLIRLPHYTFLHMGKLNRALYMSLLNYTNPNGKGTLNQQVA